jgi:hypothetical protein
MPPANFSRVVVVRTTGSGKSTVLEPREAPLLNPGKGELLIKVRIPKFVVLLIKYKGAPILEV